jgi:ribose 5-phosphate isomerase A
MAIDDAKRAAGYEAATWIKDGMVVGVGTGSTVFFFIEKLIQKCSEGLKIHAIASSRESAKLIRLGNIPLIEPTGPIKIHITVDGADEIDSQKRMIKGGGGALVREKILASSSEMVVIIIDHTKCVSLLGDKKLPVEIIPFLFQITIDKIKRLGYRGALRLEPNGQPYLTDNGNYIFDIIFDEKRIHPEKEHAALTALPGVIDTGFFFNLAKIVIVGYEDGKVRIIKNS